MTQKRRILNHAGQFTTALVEQLEGFGLALANALRRERQGRYHHPAIVDGFLRLGAVRLADYLAAVNAQVPTINANIPPGQVPPDAKRGGKKKQDKN